ncbi:MAG TPA: hypothetical protein VK559_02165 [Ferruginibacter sp.]|nr:hypothetical protein [Ferruginibacter sp.]
MNKRISIVIVFCTTLLTSCVARTYDYGYMQPVFFYPGVGLGTIIAVAISWTRNKSVLWAIVHGILGWLYVIYAIIVKEK